MKKHSSSPAVVLSERMVVQAATNPNWADHLRKISVACRAPRWRKKMNVRGFAREYVVRSITTGLPHPQMKARRTPVIHFPSHAWFEIHPSTKTK